MRFSVLLRWVGPLLLVASGCAKQSSGSTYPGAGESMPYTESSVMDSGVVPTGSSSSGYTADGAAVTRDDAMEPEEDSDVQNISAVSRPRRRGLFRSKTKDARSELASPPADGARGAESTPDANQATPSDPEPAVEQPRIDADHRHIIYTAFMQVSVFNLPEAMAKAESLPEIYGGYIHSMSEGQLVLRIPSKNLRDAMGSLGEYGVIEQRTLQAQDVTAEYVDVESRIVALEETHVQMLALLGKAKTVEEALKVRMALDQITSELEVLKGRLRQLENLTSYSTLTLRMYERGPLSPTPSSDDPFPWVNALGVESTEWK
jgi:hypothetical protein